MDDPLTGTDLKVDRVMANSVGSALVGLVGVVHVILPFQTLIRQLNMGQIVSISIIVTLLLK